MNPLSTRETYDQRLNEISADVFLLGRMVDAAIKRAMTAFKTGDFRAAQAIILADQEINEKRYAIENDCVAIIATQQPMGRDVRFLTAVLEIITELERIGDYAKGIGKVTMKMPEGTQKLPTVIILSEMAEKGLSMLEKSLDAFFASDTAAAMEIPLKDQEVDLLYNLVETEMATLVINDPQMVHTANYILWAAHNLERLADRVINICERIIYVTTGQMTEMD